MRPWIKDPTAHRGRVHRRPKLGGAVAPAAASSSIGSPERARDGGDDADRRRRCGGSSWPSCVSWEGVVRRRRAPELPRLRARAPATSWRCSSARKRGEQGVSECGDRRDAGRAQREGNGRPARRGRGRRLPRHGEVAAHCHGQQWLHGRGSGLLAVHERGW